ncbi:MAG: HD domain-containing protein [Pseudomonadota bacterium]
MTEERRVKFSRMADGDQDDFALLDQHERASAKAVGQRLLATLDMLDDAPSAYRVSRSEHSLQCATRAWFDGADSDWIAAALLHDIGDILAPYNHDEYAASVLRPYLREQCTWVVRHHGIFQRYYYAHQFGGDREARRKYRDNDYYDDAVAFCERWDQASFDPSFVCLSIDHFRPLVDEVFSREPYAACNILPAVRLPLVDARKAASRRNDAVSAA